MPARKSPSRETPSLICTVDVVLLTLKEDVLQVALLRRRNPPYDGVPALPGGYIHPHEDGSALDAATRVLREKTGIVSPYLEQLGATSGPARDPRGWSISIGYYALVAPEVIEAAAVPDLKLVDTDGKLSLPFDHRAILDSALARLRSKSQYSSLPCHLAGARFTLPHLQRIYEAVLGAPLNKSHFRRKLEEMDILEAIEGEFSASAANRPAQMYRLKPAFRGHLALLERGL